MREDVKKRREKKCPCNVIENRYEMLRRKSENCLENEHGEGMKKKSIQNAHIFFTWVDLGKMIIILPNFTSPLLDDSKTGSI